MEKQARFVVLVVEDDLLTQMNALEIVSEAGFDAVAAANADEAVTILEGRDDILVVFTDVNMPVSIDGLKLAHAVRHRWPPIEIIVTSAFSVGAKQLPEGVAFFRKPYRDEQITRTLRNFAA